MDTVEHNMPQTLRLQNAVRFSKKWTDHVIETRHLLENDSSWNWKVDKRQLMWYLLNILDLIQNIFESY